MPSNNAVNDLWKMTKRFYELDQQVSDTRTNIELILLQMLRRAARVTHGAGFDADECADLEKAYEAKMSLVREQDRLVAQWRRDGHVGAEEQQHAQSAGPPDEQKPMDPLDAMNQQLDMLQAHARDMKQHFKWDPATKKLVPLGNGQHPDLRADFVRKTRKLYEQSVETMMEGTAAAMGDGEKQVTGQLDPELRKAVQAAAKNYLLQELDTNALFQQLKKDASTDQDDAEAARGLPARQSNKGGAPSKQLSGMVALIQECMVMMLRLGGVPLSTCRSHPSEPTLRASRVLTGLWHVSPSGCRSTGSAFCARGGGQSVHTRRLPA